MKMKTVAYTALIAAATVAFAIGSATTGEAKGKKKAAAPMLYPMPCMYTPPGPVCGSLKGQKFTYANACSASKDGATVVSQKACSVKAAKKGKKSKKKSAKKATKKKM
jgi:hypothetical protein